MWLNLRLYDFLCDPGQLFLTTLILNICFCETNGLLLVPVSQGCY